LDANAPMEMQMKINQKRYISVENDMLMWMKTRNRWWSIWCFCKEKRQVNHMWKFNEKLNICSKFNIFGITHSFKILTVLRIFDYVYYILRRDIKYIYIQHMIFDICWKK
jgi:hypothetical protein